MRQAVNQYESISLSLGLKQISLNLEADTTPSKTIRKHLEDKAFEKLLRGRKGSASQPKQKQC